MLYKISVFKFSGNKKRKVYSTEISAKDILGAVEKAYVRLGPDRIAEIQEIHPEYPAVNRIARNGVI